MVSVKLVHVSGSQVPPGGHDHSVFAHVSDSQVLPGGHEHSVLVHVANSPVPLEVTNIVCVCACVGLADAPWRSRT